MRFLSIITATLSVIAGLVAAGQNPIIFPGTDAQINAGTTVEITWNPTAGATITLKLMYGQIQNLQTGTTIACKFSFHDNLPITMYYVTNASTNAAAIANSGSFFWVVPDNIGNGQWSIGITDGVDADDNYSPFFIIAGGSGKQGAAGSASATAAPTTAAITNSAISAFLATATGGVTSSAMAVPTGIARAGGIGMGLAAAVGALVL
jgi:hypothetical protein